MIQFLISLPRDFFISKQSCIPHIYPYIYGVLIYIYIDDPARRCSLTEKVYKIIPLECV